MESKEPSSISDLAKKIIYASLGSAVMARSAVSDAKIPKEVLGTLISKAEKGKNELMQILGREVSKFFSKINVSEEVAKALKGLSVHVNATVEFSEKKGGKPKAIIHKVQVRKASKKS